jgi:hypothetical protein
MLSNSFVLQVNMVNNHIEPSFAHNHSVGYVQKALSISNVSGRDTPILPFMAILNQFLFVPLAHLFLSEKKRLHKM